MTSGQLAGESQSLRDIKAERVPDLDWTPQGRTKSLTQTVGYASGYADQSATWYLRHKKWKRYGARWLRCFVIVLVAGAGVLPMVQQLLVGQFPEPGQVTMTIPPVWASILLAAAVFLVALDRFFGFSSGWIRYTTAEGQIRRLRQDFELDWQALLASYAGAPPTPEQVQHALAWVKAFVGQVNAIIGDETTKWVAEFQEALKQVDEQVRTVPAAVQSGSLAVSVTNGSTVDPAGWTMTVDLGQAQTYIGKSAAVVGLLPGDHLVRLQGKVNGKDVRAEAVATVRAGASTNVEITLA